MGYGGLRQSAAINGGAGPGSARNFAGVRPRPLLVWVISRSFIMRLRTTESLGRGMGQPSFCRASAMSWRVNSPVIRCRTHLIALPVPAQPVLRAWSCRFTGGARDRRAARRGFGYRGELDSRCGGRRGRDGESLVAVGAEELVSSKEAFAFRDLVQELVFAGGYFFRCHRHALRESNCNARRRPEWLLLQFTRRALPAAVAAYAGYFSR